MKHYDESNDQRGGLSYLYVIPLTSFLRYRHDYLTGLDYPEFTRRTDIIQLPVSEGTEWSEEEKITSGGHLYSIKISGTLKKSDRIGPHILRELECGSWMVLHIDSLGVCRMSGSEEVPMCFELTSKSGSAPSSSNIRSFTFSCSQATPSVICSVDLPL